MRKPVPKPPPKQIRGPAGCLVLLAVLIVEFAAGAATTYIAYRVFFAVFEALGWTGERDFAKVMAIFLGFFVAVPVVGVIDAWCKRRTGRSALEQLPLIP